MKKSLMIGLSVAIALSSVLAFVPQQADAVPAFNNEFKAMYVKADSTDEKDVALVAAVKKVKCNVCHEGKKKTDRNAYGMALSELLDKKKDVKDKEKIQESLKKVAEMKSNPADPESKTFGELIAEGKLPSEEKPATEE
jgi:cytochrome c2